MTRVDCFRPHDIVDIPRRESSRTFSSSSFPAWSTFSLFSPFFSPAATYNCVVWTFRIPHDTQRLYYEAYSNRILMAFETDFSIQLVGSSAGMHVSRDVRGQRQGSTKEAG